MQSGTTGINTLRIYNPVKQGHDQDPDGAFVRAWVPELAAVPDAFLHEPWRWEGAAGLAYPAPVVDNAEAMRAARETLHALRRDSGHKGAARAIATKHGSRKSGLTGTDTRRRSRAKPTDSVQLTLDFS
jgi:deoxyribodipyrimidine photo-lyase